MSDFSDIVGMTFTEVTNTGDAIRFTEESGRQLVLQHHQECCEYVSVEEVTGDLADLVGTPIVHASERKEDKPGADFGMWTFYHVSTTKGTVVIRFYGSSNGYYSVGVRFDETT